jgi:hypothetical protein
MPRRLIQIALAAVTIAVVVVTARDVWRRRERARQDALASEIPEWLLKPDHRPIRLPYHMAPSYPAAAALLGGEDLVFNDYEGARLRLHADGRVEHLAVIPPAPAPAWRGELGEMRTAVEDTTGDKVYMATRVRGRWRIVEGSRATRATHPWGPVLPGWVWSMTRGDEGRLLVTVSDEKAGGTALLEVTPERARVVARRLLASPYIVGRDGATLWVKGELFDDTSTACRRAGPHRVLELMRIDLGTGSADCPYAALPRSGELAQAFAVGKRVVLHLEDEQVAVDDGGRLWQAYAYWRPREQVHVVESSGGTLAILDDVLGERTLYLIREEGEPLAIRLDEAVSALRWEEPTR